MSDSTDKTPGLDSYPDRIAENAPLPLNRYKLTHADVVAVYNSILGRQPEEECWLVGKNALDGILAVANSHEARMRNQASLLPTAELHLSQGKYGKFVTYPDDQVIGAAIRKYGQFEEDAVSEALSLLARINVDVQLTTFLDIGANIGTHNIAALKFGFQRAVCVEANAKNYNLLRINHILNDVDEVCIDVRSAISNVDGLAALELSTSNFGDHRIRVHGAADGPELYDEGDRSHETVPVCRLDTLFRKLSIHPERIGLVWIDTQGHEGHVLSGASMLLASKSPLVMEFWPYGLSRSGGYPILRDALAQRDRCIDLRRSIEAGSTVIYALEDLDRMYSTMLAESSPTQMPHTDLLVL